MLIYIHLYSGDQVMIKGTKRLSKKQQYYRFSCMMHIYNCVAVVKTST